MNLKQRVKELLSHHGELRSQPSSDWKGDFALPEALSEFYRDIGPVDVSIEAPRDSFFLPKLADLWNFQAGYRWHGITLERLPGWEDDWIVVADQGGDPFIFSRSSGHILFAYHGEGRCSPEKLFSDIYIMSACLAELGNFGQEVGKEFCNDDIKLKFL
jgi:hypothetical protein